MSAGIEETIIKAEINPSEVRQWRLEEAIYPNRRPLLYREIVNRHKSDVTISSVEAQKPKESMVF